MVLRFDYTAPYEMKQTLLALLPYIEHHEDYPQGQSSASQRQLSRNQDTREIPRAALQGTQPPASLHPQRGFHRLRTNAMHGAEQNTKRVQSRSLLDLSAGSARSARALQTVRVPCLLLPYLLHLVLGDRRHRCPTSPAVHSCATSARDPCAACDKCKQSQHSCLLL